MAASTFFIPSVNMIGSGCLEEAANTMKQQGLGYALIVTDKVLNNIGVVAQVQQLLAAQHIESCVYDGTHPNPTTLNVKQGLALLQRTPVRLCRLARWGLTARLCQRYCTAGD